MLKSTFFKNASILSLLIAGTPRLAQANAVFCLAPGASGGGSYVHNQLPKILARQGVPFITFKTGDKGTIIARAERLRILFEARLQKEPNLRCHLLGNSYGGLTARYAYRHLSVKHPTLGVRPFSYFVDTYTSLQAVNYGVEYLRPYAKLENGEPNGAMQLTPEYMEMFTNPEYTGTYSPLPDAIPHYNFRTFIESKKDIIRFEESLIYTHILKWLTQHQQKPLIDGLVTLDQQAGGTVLADLRLPHGFFNFRTPRKIPFKNYEFYPLYWKFLQAQSKGTTPSQGESPLEELRHAFRERGLLSETETKEATTH